MKVFTLKMGTIQTGLLVGFGHRPLNKFPLKQGENNEGNHSLPEAERTVFIHITENGNVAGEADDGEARQKRQEAAEPAAPAGSMQHERSTASVASVTSASRMCGRARVWPLLRFGPYSPYRTAGSTHTGEEV